MTPILKKKNQEYVDSIKNNVSWLGFSWEQNKISHLFFASHYFDFMYQAAESLIQSGHAYVDKQTSDEITYTSRVAHRAWQKFSMA